MQPTLDGGTVECLSVGMESVALGACSKCEQRALRHALGHERRDEDIPLRQRPVAVEGNGIHVHELGKCTHAAACNAVRTQMSLDPQGDQPA